MLYGFLGVGEGPFAHGGQSVVGALGEIREDARGQVGFAARRGTLDGDAYGLLKEAAGQGKVEELEDPRLAGDSGLFERPCKAVQDAIFFYQLFARLPRFSVPGFCLGTGFLSPSPGPLERLPQVLLEVLRVLKVELVGSLAPSSSHDEASRAEGRQRAAPTGPHRLRLVPRRRRASLCP